MKIIGIEGLTHEQLAQALQEGGRFVLYKYCVSLIVITMMRPSDIYFVRGHESRVLRGMSYTCISLVAGWWGIPFGPIYTVMSLFNNLGGGKDVTAEVLQSIR